MASAANAPATKAAPKARHPWSLLTMMRRSGCGRRRRRRRPHTQAPDAPWVDIEHFELDAGRVTHHLATLGDASEQGADQAAHGVDLAPRVLRQHASDLLLQELDGRAAVDVDRAVDAARHGRRLGDVMLVLDLAHDLLDQVLDGEQAVGAAELV